MADWQAPDSPPSGPVAHSRFALGARRPGRYRQNRGVLIAPKVSCLSVQLDEKESSRLQIEIKVQGDHSACSKPPVDFKTKVPFWPGRDRPGHSGTLVFKSTGGFEQVEWSPCTVLLK